MGSLRANAPLIQSGIEFPVRKPTQSFVKELQLRSIIVSVLLGFCTGKRTYLASGTVCDHVRNSALGGVGSVLTLSAV